jgi:hypothetical protein
MRQIFSIAEFKRRAEELLGTVARGVEDRSYVVKRLIGSPELWDQTSKPFVQRVSLGLQILDPCYRFKISALKENYGHEVRYDLYGLSAYYRLGEFTVDLCDIVGPDEMLSLVVDDDLGHLHRAWLLTELLFFQINCDAAFMSGLPPFQAESSADVEWESTCDSIRGILQIVMAKKSIGAVSIRDVLLSKQIDNPPNRTVADDFVPSMLLRAFSIADMDRGASANLLYTIISAIIKAAPDSTEQAHLFLDCLDDESLIG